jgi:sulfur carrier protein
MSEEITQGVGISVTINRKVYALPLNASLADAVTLAGIRPPFAAAVNMQFVPRASYSTHTLQLNDQIELISPITGG